MGFCYLLYILCLNGCPLDYTAASFINYSFVSKGNTPVLAVDGNSRLYCLSFKPLSFFGVTVPLMAALP